jgi:hypothetical protein
MNTAARSLPPARRPTGAPVPAEAEVRRRLAQASVQLVALRCELDLLQADLSWLQVTAAGGPDLGQDPA